MTHADDIRVGNQLAHVFVVRNDHGLQFLFGDFFRERADNVVRFKTRRVDHRNVEGLAESDNVWKLLARSSGMATRLAL